MNPILESLTREWIQSLLFHAPPGSGVDGLLRLAGVVHLYGASGIHLYAILNWTEWAILRIGRLLNCPARLAGWVVLGLFLGASFLIWRTHGFSLSLFRPFSSILIRAFLREAGLRVWIFLPLLITLLLERIFCAGEGLSPGAHHYYLAVGGSLVALTRSHSTPSGLRLHFEMAVFSWVPIALLDFFHDGLASPLTPVLSLITIPPLTVILYPLALGSVALTGEVHTFVFLAGASILKGALSVLDVVPSVFTVSRSAGFIAGALIVGSKLLPLRIFSGKSPLNAFIHWSSLGVLILFLRFALMLDSPNRVIQLDVGQGDSTLIQEGSRAELMDLGPEPGRGVEAWIRRLSRYGITRIDGVLLTHLDQDHAGGLHTLVSAIPVECIEISRPHQATETGMKIRRWVDSLPLSVHLMDSGCIRLSEVAWFHSTRPGSAGNRWMGGFVREISDHEMFLSLGDGDQEQELQFEKKFKGPIQQSRFRIWKVGHHGSKFSSDPGFLARLGAGEFWISVGRKNPYHHPAAETLARIGRSRGKVRRTDEEGDLVFTGTEDPPGTPASHRRSGFF